MTEKTLGHSSQLWSGSVLMRTTTETSAHVLHNIIEFRVNIYAAQKMRLGGSWFPLPKRIQDTRAVINPKNKDDRCFLYAVYLGLLNLSK